MSGSVRSPRVRRTAAALLLLVPFLVRCRGGEPKDDRVADGRVPEIAKAPSVLAGTPLYSQGKEELIVRDFFHDRRDGFFLDVGCASPIQNSNTYYLEKHLDWSGIGVDALAEFEPAWRKKRPRSQFFNFLVSDRDGAVEPFFRAERRGISTARAEKTTGPGGRPVKYQRLEVPSVTLNTLLQRSGVTKVDFMSMDIEGAEPQALAGFDIERFRPELVCIEAKPEAREAILRYFEAHGYARIERYAAYDETNYYFTPQAGGR